MNQNVKTLTPTASAPDRGYFARKRKTGDPAHSPDQMPRKMPVDDPKKAEKIRRYNRMTGK